MEGPQGKGPLSLLLLQEVALEGLEGLTIDGLWKRLSPVLGIDLPFVENFQNLIWNFIKKSETLFQFYELPEPREKLKIFNRLDYADPETGDFVLPDECPLTRYKFCPIEDGEIKGSCEFYKERKNISFNEVKSMSLDEVLGRWGDKFVIIAVQHIREHFLIPETIQIPRDLTAQQYCFLELIGRSRYNGEATCGKHSMSCFFKDSALLFYIKNKLIEYKLITRQFYYEKIHNRTCSGQLLMLPKFYVEYKSKVMNMIETLFRLIKSSEKGILVSNDLPNYFKFEYHSTFKKLKLYGAFRRCFVLERVPYREVYPDADESEYMQKNKTKEKFVLAYKLKDPDMNIDDIWLEDENKEETDTIGFLNHENYYIDMPIINQIYKYIDDHKEKGVSQADIIKNLGINHYMARAVLKKLKSINVVRVYMQDCGRQRTGMYLTAKYAKIRSETVSAVQNELPNSESVLNESLELTQNTAEETITDTTIDLSQNKIKPQNHKELDIGNSESDPGGIAEKKMTESDLLLIDVSVKESFNPIYKTDTQWIKKLTERQKERKDLIINIVENKKLIEFPILHKMIKVTESKKGYKEELCRKSLTRLVSHLVDQGKFRSYELILKRESYAKALKYVSVPSIQASDEIFQEEIKKCKIAMHLSILDKENRQKAAIKHLEVTEKSVSGTAVSNKNNPPPRLPKDVPRTPKFLRAQHYHEILVYLAYELKRDTAPIPVTDEISRKWEECEPTINTVDILQDLPKVYSETISWKMFIPPLPVYQKVPEGWIYFKDITSRLPLSLIAKTNWIQKSPDSVLSKYLDHPIRQHYIADSIPEIASEILQNNINFYQVDEIIQLLGNMGLAQVGEKAFREIQRSWVYVNKNAKLVDTSSSDPGYNTISTNKEYPEHYYTFESVNNALEYWADLQKFALTTKLGRNVRSTKQKKRLSRYINKLETVSFKDAILKDFGYIPGDHLGAGGLDTNLCVHIRRSWSWQLGKEIRPIKPVAKPAIETFAKTKKTKTKEVVQKKKTKLTLVTGRKVSLKRIMTTGVQKRNLRHEYDDIDKEALKRMKSLRVTWTPEEDRILKICRVVYRYLANPMATRVIQFSTIRDILQWSISSLNKTARACHRRIVFLARYKKDLPDTDAWLHELRQNRYIMKLYGPTFLNDLKKVYRSDKEYASALKIHFIKLVCYLMKILNHSNVPMSNEIILPDTLNQFNMLYQCSPNLSEKDCLKYHDPNSYEDVQLSTINGLIHSSVCCTKDKTLYNIQLFDIYKGYDEKILAKAFSKVKSDRLVVTPKSKDVPNSCQKLLAVGPSLTLSIKYRHQLFIRFSYSCVDECYQACQTFQQTNFVQGDLYEFNSLDAGAFLFVSELLTRRDISIDVQLPHRILTVDPNQEKCKDSERILEHFRRLFENAPKREYTKHFEEKYKGSGSQPKIRFNVINESYKMPYNPYDILAKLSDHYLHFFCVVNHLNKEVDLNIQKLGEKNCPFECVLKDANYIASIERIISEKRSVLEHLSEDYDYDELMETKVIVTPENLTQIFNSFVNILKVQSKKLYQKDLGKSSMRPQAVNVILLAKELLDYCRDDINLDIEYMPIFNKEDKIIKAQDIFVVNLSKVKVNVLDDNEITSFDEEEKLKFKGVLVPDSGTNGLGYDKDEILNKIISEYIFQMQNSTVEKLEEDMLAESFSKREQDFTKEILKYIKWNEFGVSGEDLLNEFCDEELLIKGLSLLRKHCLVMRVGVENYKYVHKNHIQPWIVQTYHIKRLEKEALPPNAHPENCLSSENVDKDDSEPPSKRTRLETEKEETDIKRDFRMTGSAHKQRERIILRPCPWMRVNGSLNRRVLDKWMGTILLECITLNGTEVLSLCFHFSMLHPVNILFLLEILQDIGCIHLKSKRSKETTVLSDYEDPIIGDANELTKKENMFVIVRPDAITKFSQFVGDKKYKTDFV